MIIALVGLAQSGKDTTADHLCSDYGFDRLSFAEPLKKIAYDIDPLIHVDGTHAQEAVDAHGWDYVKTHYPEARRFLQRIGTEGLRQNVDDDFWVNLAISKMGDASKRYVITDMRFLNEQEKIAQFASDHGHTYEVWRLQRNGLTLMNHASETELARIPTSQTLDNNGTVEELYANVDILADRFLLTA